MEDQILKSMLRYVPDLANLAKTDRPDADYGSVEAAAAVSMLIATIYLLNTFPRTAEIEATIDALIDRLPRSMEDRTVSLQHAMLDESLQERASTFIYGAYNTNLLGAFDAIYNTRISMDMTMMKELEDGPGGPMASVAAVVGQALFGAGNRAPMIETMAIFDKHYANIVGANNAHRKSPNQATPTGAGSSSCFVATACYGSPNQDTVIVFRRFRESVLKRSNWGRWFTKTYYKLSPPLADAIRHHALVRTPITHALNLGAKAIQLFTKAE